jgi:hypothetical protein
MTYDETRHVIGGFRCRRGHAGKGEVYVSAAKDSWFENSKMSIEKSLLLTYAFAVGMSYDDAQRETSVENELTARETVSDWYSS